jgi:peptide/nickel transport system permease protein
MQKYILSRLGQSILILVGVLILVFFMLRLTGDPVALLIPREASPETVAEFRKSMGLDRPLPLQFVEFVRHAIVGDFGNSFRYRTDALTLILDRLPATIELATVSLALALAVAIPLGLIGGSNPGSRWDAVARALGLLGQSIPNFWLALLLIIVFAVELRWLPSFGRDSWKSVILPAFALGMTPMGQLVRLTRAAVLDIRSTDYIRTAYSKGLPSRLVYSRHVLRNAAIPLISVLGIQFGYLLGGSIYIETIFSWPGIGNLIAEAIGVRDFTLVQAVAVFSSVVVVILNLFTDIAYAMIDPRIRYG